MALGFTHDGLQEDLAAQLRGNTSRMVWTNTQLGPSGSPRPDVFTMDKSFSRFCSDCYEVKVSMSDLRSDVTSGKWQKYLKFGSRVWFAFERGMAPLDLIPKECGVILRGDAGWRAARKPVAQALSTLPHDAWMKLLIECHPDWLSLASAPRVRSANTLSVEKVLRKRIGDNAARLFRDVDLAEARLRYERAEIEERIKEIDERAEKRRIQAEAYERQHRQVLDSDMLELGALLGVPREQCDIHALMGAIRQFRSALRGTDLQRAISALQVLSGDIQKTGEGQLA